MYSKTQRITFIANYNIGAGFSGGDRIFTEFLRHWQGKAHLTLMGSEEAILASRRNNITPRVLQTDVRNANADMGLFNLLRHTCRRLRKGLKALREFRGELADTDIVYSVSDFYPDFIPAFVMKRRNPKMMWIAGYYLFAPAPWAKESPYKGVHRLRGLIYWLTQRPSHFLVKRYADKVFVTSEPDVQRFVTPKRLRENVIVVQGGVDVTASEAYLNGADVVAVEKRKYDACFIGRLHYQKGVLILLDIWARVCRERPGALLAIIGDGHLENEVRAKITALGLGGNVEMLGFMDGERKFEVFKQSKLMVHPSTYDSGGMAAAEGMAWKLPGVSFDLEALKTYYPQGMIKTPCFETQTFADNILHLLTDKDFHARWADDAHELIVTVWDWKKRSETIWSLLNIRE